MCDYSLEAYRSRPAVRGERYTLHRFPSGSKGFVSPGDCKTAVCIAPDTRLRVTGIPDEVCSVYGVGSSEEVTFLRLDEHWYRDGVKFDSGLELSLQRLPNGITATISVALDQPMPALRVPVMAE